MSWELHESKVGTLFLLSPIAQSTFISEVSYIKKQAKQAKENDLNAMKTPRIA